MKTCMMGVMLATLTGMAAAQPVQWLVEDGGNGHWYEFVRAATVPISWTAASEIARGQGGYLATPTSPAENGFVFSTCPPTNNWPSDFGPWLGGFQESGSVESAAGWRWVSGEAWEWTGWLWGEPNNAACGGFSEDKLHYASFAPGWNDLLDSGQTCGKNVWGYVIEWSADCNNDGIVDKGQILSGQLPDANNNGIPDGVAIATQPTDQNVGVDTPVAFVVEVGTDPVCTTPVTYQWQRRNPLVADPELPNAWIDLVDGNGIFGTRAPNLTLLRPIPGLATGYRCKIGGGCGCEPGQGGFVYTNTVNFSVACPADFNADGGIDFGDVEAFFERWENGC